MFWKRDNSSSGPDYWQTYLGHFKTRMPAKTPISDLRFWVLDTETTGLDLKRDELLSLAAIPVENYSMPLSHSYECYFQQEKKPEEKGIAIHGIIPVANLPMQPLDQILPEFLSKIENRIMVGHHIRFDFEMLNKMVKRKTGDTLKNLIIDTAHLARRLPAFKDRPQNKGLSLDELCHYYGLKRHGRHTAVGDSFLTARILCYQLKALESQGVTTLSDLLRKPLKIHRY